MFSTFVANAFNEEPEQLNRHHSIDIHGQPVTSDILVALLDRSNEMKQLAARNAPFYDMIEHYITETQGTFAWQKFQEVVYKPRDKLPDKAWMTQITHFLHSNPVFLSKFKETVGYEEEDQAPTPPPPPHKSCSTPISNIARRRSRRLSSMSLGDVLNNEENDLEEEAPKAPESMFSTEDQFYQQRRRRSSYHSIQSEPHPTSVEFCIDEVDEAEIEDVDFTAADDSDHLSELLDNSSDSEDESLDQRVSYHQNVASARRRSGDQDLIRLREYPEFQQDLPQTHPQFFRKAKQLMCMAQSSRQLSATVRRNSILENGIPSPVTELDEPRVQTCDQQEDEEQQDLAHLICCTRRQQPDDVAWFNGVMEALAGWPELVDRLHEIVDEALD